MIRDYKGEPAGRSADLRRATAGAGRRRWVRWAHRGAALIALAAGLAWAGGRAARAMAPWTYFRLAEVSVEGNLRLGREDVLRALDLPPAPNLLALDLEELGARLAANPWVKEVSVQRCPPDRLLVRLVERAPAAILLAGGASLVSEDGVILDKEGEEPDAALPVLRAPEGRRYEVGEHVAPQELAAALGVWRQVQLAPALGGRRPQEVGLAADGSYRVAMGPGDVALRLRAEGLDPQLKRLGSVLALRGRGLEDVEEVDLRFLDKVILRQRPVGLRTTEGPAGAPSAAGRAGGPPVGRPGVAPGPTDLRPWADRPGGR